MSDSLIIQDNANEDFKLLCQRVARLGEALSMSAPDTVLYLYFGLIQQSINALVKNNSSYMFDV
jgi:hypothetical protein